MTTETFQLRELVMIPNHFACIENEIGRWPDEHFPSMCETSSGNVTKFKKSDCRLYSQFQVHLNTAHTAYSVRPHAALFTDVSSSSLWVELDEQKRHSSEYSGRQKLCRQMKWFIILSPPKSYFHSQCSHFARASYLQNTCSLVRRKLIYEAFKVLTSNVVWD